MVLEFDDLFHELLLLASFFISENVIICGLSSFRMLSFSGSAWLYFTPSTVGELRYADALAY